MATNFEVVRIGEQGERAELYAKLKKELYDEAEELWKEGGEVVMIILPPFFNLRTENISRPSDVFHLVDFLCYTQTKSNEEWGEFILKVLGEMDNVDRSDPAGMKALAGKFFETMTAEEVKIMSFVLGALYRLLNNETEDEGDDEEEDEGDEEEEDVATPTDSAAPAA